MGFLKKLTKPLSKFLDKIIPNEIKPALPYLSAFAPFMLGPGAAAGSWWQKALYNPALRAGIMGGTNIAAQLAQEGSEGEFSGLSALLAGGTGALTAGGAPEMFRGMQNRGTWEGVGSASGPGLGGVYTPPPTDVGMMTSISDAIGKGGETASKYLIESGDILRPGGAEAGLNMETLGALGTPVTQGTADLALADARRANRDYERQMAEDESQSLIDDEGRRRAIRSAMEAGGHAEETILDALASLGLREGGIVGLKHGGRIGYIHGGVTHPDGRRGFFKGAERDARAGKAAMSPGTSVSGGMRAGFGNTGNTGTGTTTITTPIEEKIKTKTINEPIGILANLKNIFGYRSDEDEDETDPLNTMKDVKTISDIDSPYYNAAKAINPNLKSDVYGGMTKNEYLASILRDGGRVGLLRGGDPDDYSQQQDVGTFELQQEEGVPIGPMVQEDRQKQLLKAFAEYQAGGGTLSLKEFAVMWMRENAAGGGMMGVLPKGKEMDYRGGGVIPIGSKERADDVPARLSKNEFVMTADAVKAAGGGSVNRGAKKMYNLMHNLEARV